MDTEFPEIPARQSLSVRIVVASLAALAAVVTMVAGTLWLSWQLEGGAAAINDAGSLRMRTYRLALTLDENPSPAPERAREDMARMDATLAELERGNPARPLFLPDDEAIRRQYQQVGRAWLQLRSHAEKALRGDRPALVAYRDAADGFVAEINRLVSLIEHDNASKTAWLRLSQATLIAMAIAGTVAMIFLLYLWIIRPVLRLREGIGRMAAREFDVRLPVETHDEFGVLTEGFNTMAAELADLYRSLETRVQSKTAQLEAQNRELSTLYDVTAFLSAPSTVESLCQGFTDRLVQLFSADGGSVRLADPDGAQIRLTVSSGLPSTLVQSEQCLRAHECLCGEALRRGPMIVRDFRKLPSPRTVPCVAEGFHGVCVSPIASPQGVLGTFALHFRQERQWLPAETQLLETLGQHLGLTLENLQLGAKERQLAVLEERNLVAQGLHDSIAQSLNFLNLQVQMLEAALTRKNLGEANHVVPSLRAGVEQSYNDIRELLTNFRSRLESGQLEETLRQTLSRFGQQTGIETALEIRGGGPPLQPEQQLQALFIAQEALSNIRKHARAGKATIRIDNDSDYRLEIEDDGQGFDPAALARQNDQHVGLSIMRERSFRLGAELEVRSRPGGGTAIRLLVPRSRAFSPDERNERQSDPPSAG